jgi:D-proline reductase (dithiol) PrdB
MHIDPALGERDMNCLLPVERLEELVASGKVGRTAASHYSFMGYILDPTVLLGKSIPAIIEHLLADAVDLVVLVPA